MSNMITVGISDLNIALGSHILVTYALGSCVGICLYDPVSRVAGLSHIMLPSILDFSGGVQVREKYADTAIELLLTKMQAAGAVPVRVRAKIAGGAQMFKSLSNQTLAGIGERNTTAVKKELLRLRIPIIAEDTGKDYGRTVFFSAEDGVMRVKSASRGEWLL